MINETILISSYRFFLLSQQSTNFTYIIIWYTFPILCGIQELAAASHIIKLHQCLSRKLMIQGYIKDRFVLFMKKVRKSITLPYSKNSVSTLQIIHDILEEAILGCEVMQFFCVLSFWRGSEFIHLVIV